MQKHRLKELLNQAIDYSKQSKVKRLITKPYRTLGKFLLFRFTKKLKLTKQVKTRLFFGSKMYLVLPDPVSVFLSNFGFFEKGLTNLVIECLNEGDVFVDVGAHFGYYTLLSSVIVGETGEVHSFEPTPTVLKILKKNSGGKSNVTINNYALSDKVSNEDFYDAGLKYSAFNGFNVPEFNEIGDSKVAIKKIKVSCLTLDNYFEKKKRQPDFIKIDAEDAELPILRGMTNIINKNHPIISLETGDHGNSTTREKIEYLIDLGYTPYEYSGDRLVKHIIKEKYGYANLLFLNNN